MNQNGIGQDPVAHAPDLPRRLQEVASWRAIIETAEVRLAQLGADHPAANEQPRANQAPADENKPPER